MLTEKKLTGKSTLPSKIAAKKSSRARRVSKGDIPPNNSSLGIEKFSVNEKLAAARDSKSIAVQDIINRITTGTDITSLPEALQAILDGASPDDATALSKAIANMPNIESSKVLTNADDALANDWRNGAYPYKNLLSRRSYEKQKYHLQVELLKLQAWVKETGQRVVILFEGRDAAGKGGTIRRFMEHLNPRGARVVALEKPSEVEIGQWYFQRYATHLLTLI